MNIRKQVLGLVARSLGGQVISLNDPSGWEDVFSSKTAAGVRVTSNTAMNLAAVFACVRLSTETMSTLPIHVYKKTRTGREVVENHPVTKLLSRQANPEMPANVFREVIQGHLELRGCAYAEIVRNGYGDPVELWPIHPDHMRPIRNKKGVLQYTYLPTGYIFPAQKILHIRGLGSNGIDSYSVISLARDSIGLGIAAQTYGARFFGQGTNMGGFLRHPKGLSDQAYERLKAEMNNKYKGLEKAHELIILEDGLEFQKVGVSNEDAQFLETRKFQISEVARWFGMKPHMIGDLEKATFSNIEQQSIEAVTYTWRPRAVRIEQEIAVKLLKEDEYLKISLEGLLRGDIKSRYEAYKIAFENSWMNADEIRSLEDMNPQPDGLGKIFMAPLNMGDKRKLLADTPATVDTAGIAGVIEKVQNGEITIKNGKALLEVLFQMDSDQIDSLLEPQKNSSRSNMRDPETRAQIERRSLADRRMVADSYRVQIRKLAQGLVDEEVRMIRKALEDSSDEEFSSWLTESYPQFASRMQEIFLPLFTQMSEQLYPIYAGEAGLDEKEIPQEYRDLVIKYVSGFALRYTSSSAGQLRKLIEEFAAEYRERVEERLSSWQQTNAQKVEQREVTRIRNYLARGAYAVAGITRIRSVAHGDTCPYCNALDGKVIDIQKTFISKGEEFKPEGADSALIPHTNRSHPPYHDGCDCDIVAEGV